MRAAGVAVGSQRSVLLVSFFALQLSCIRRAREPRLVLCWLVCLTPASNGMSASCWTYWRRVRHIRRRLDGSPRLSSKQPQLFQASILSQKPTRRVRSPPTPVASAAVGASLTLLQSCQRVETARPAPPLHTYQKHKKCVSSRSVFSARPRRARGPGPIERPSPGVV